jgi:release factor glutamine methyltransferase
MPTLADLTIAIRGWLLALGIDACESHLETELIVEHVTGLSTARQLLASDGPVSDEIARTVDDIMARRAQREPLQYCLGHTYFMGLRMMVRPGVLIPRADTEILVESALELLAGIANPLIADIGTGSGAIAVAMAALRPDARVIAVDISEDALAVARENAAAHSLSERIEFVHSEWSHFQCAQPLHAIVSNPPYIPVGLIDTLAPEVAKHEPKEALFGSDPDGLGFYRDFAHSAAQFLREGGFLCVEVGQGQAELVADILRAAGWSDIRVKNDLNAISRVVTGFRPN